MRVALAQMDVCQGSKKDNLRKVDAFLRQAAEGNSDIACFPEYFTTGYSRPLSEFAEFIPGPTTKTLQAQASRRQVSIAGSMLETDGNRLYNAGFLITPNGLVLTHRKVHLYGKEKRALSGGTRFQTPGAFWERLGLMVWYDMAFSEPARQWTHQGAKVIFVPSNWMRPFAKEWNSASRSRARENHVWIVAVNRVGSDDEHDYFGRSRIIDPSGRIVAECTQQEELRIVDVNLTPSRPES